MSQFFDYRVTGGAPGETLQASWCNKDPIMAVAYSSNEIRFYNDEGGAIGKSITKECAPVALSWHPSSDVLASGWQDGTIQVVSFNSLHPREDQVVHHAPITALVWSTDGKRLISGDADGVVGVWKPDGRGRLAPICHYRKKGAINHIVYLEEENTMTPEEERKSDSPKITSFFFGGDDGVVCYADDMGHCTAVLENLHSPISVMDFYQEKRHLVIITRSLTLTTLEVAPNGVLNSVQRVKLSGKGSEGISQGEWVGPGLLATVCIEESLIRVWDLADNNNYHLSLSSADTRVPSSDKLVCLAYNNRTGVLAAGTAEGRVLMWRHYQAARREGDDGPTSSAAHWQGIHYVEVQKPVQRLRWAAGPHGLLATTMYDDASVLNETVLYRKVSSEYAAIQLSRNQLQLEKAKSSPIPVTTGINIKGMDICDNHLIVWNGTAAEVYEISSAGANLVSTFESTAVSMALFGDSVFCTTENHVVVQNLQGHITHTLSFTDTEGRPEHVSVMNKHLAVSTAKGKIKLYSLTRVRPRQVGSPGQFVNADTKESLGTITSIAVNANGTRVSLLAASSLGGSLRVPDNRVFVYNTEMDRVSFYDCGASQFPRSHYWDPEEPKLLAVETYKVRNGAVASASKTEEAPKDGKSDGKRRRKRRKGEEVDPDVNILTLFATPSDGVIMQDSMGLDINYDALLGLKVPHLYFVNKADDSTGGSKSRRLRTKPLRDFIGLDKADEDTRRALLDFSYYLSIGSMDEAYKAVRLIENPAVWDNMAHMCVKSKRLDVAVVCLGNMRHARGAQAVREAMKEPEHDAAVAMLAVQLGLLTDAAKLYEGCKRYDLLNKLYQASGQWEKALAIAQKSDRIHLKTTHYLYAKYLESIGDTAGAIKHYEEAGAHRYEVPRMLFDSQHLDELEAYINAGEDKELLKWWAQFCESKRDFDKAVQFYQRAGDVLSLCRVYCYNNDFNSAAELVLESGDVSAAYHLARQHEAQGTLKEAIQFFERAGRFNHAVRLAKEAGLDGELMNMALQSSKDTMVDVARYFESKGVHDKAVQLYQKGGNIPKALDLCFKANLFEDLRIISDELGDNSSPEILARCSAFFIENGQYDKAVQLQITAKNYHAALDLCMAHNVTITETMMDRMTPPKPAKGDKAAVAPRLELLKKMGRCAKKQGSYHLATKMYTMAKDKLKAMKCLLKSGDTEKIIFYAGVSRSRDIYVLAANYLQQLDWHNEPDIMKAIINFYTKARAFDQLSNFYDACAQVEIDEYRNYEKALGAMKEAEKYLGRSRSADKERRVQNLQERVDLVDRFVQARKMVKSDPNEMVKICHGLLEAGEVENSIRVGDVFALLIEYYYSKRNMEQAYHLVEDMRGRNIILSPYLDQKMVSDIYHAVGAAPAETTVDDDSDGIDEDIVESEDDM